MSKRVDVSLGFFLYINHYSAINGSNAKTANRHKCKKTKAAIEKNAPEILALRRLEIAEVTFKVTQSRCR